MTREKAADFLEISTRTLDRYVRSRILPIHKKGRRAVFSKNDLLALQKSPGHKAEIADEQEALVPHQENLAAFAGLLEKMHDEMRRKDDVIFRLNFELGASREREKSMTLLLESGGKKAEKEEDLEKSLFSARAGRTLFFGLFAGSLGAIGILISVLFSQ